LNAEDLLKVPGIGKKTFEKIAPFIEIQNEKNRGKNSKGNHGNKI